MLLFKTNFRRLLINFHKEKIKRYKAYYLLALFPWIEKKTLDVKLVEFLNS
jgi:hypothetical protein